jgi:energy-coupling factor transporter ATP-binding protein EcfA2
MSSSMARRSGKPLALPFLKELEDHLAQRGLKRFQRHADLRSPAAGYWQAPRFRIADHFDFDPDLLILEPELGVLGPVFWIEGATEKNSKVTSEQVRQRIDQATYLRHLVAQHVTGSRQAFAVEVVLVLSGDKASLRTAVESLRDIARSTDSLHSVGINLLPYGATPQPFAEGTLRRAFCWLLRETRIWYQSQFAQPPLVSAGADTRFSRLSSVTLDNFRLAGRRTLELEALNGLRVHLLHGHNGCGKSTIVEALELAWTGRIERLQKLDLKGYPGVLRNRGTDRGVAPAGTDGFQLRYSEGGTEALDLALLETQVPEPRALKAISFRLNQAVMNRLTSLEQAERSRTFLEAFFPEESGQLAVFEAAERALREARQRLPPSLQAALESGRLGWCLEPGFQVKRADLLELVPLSAATVQRLALLVNDPLDWTAQEIPGNEVVAWLESCDRVLTQVLLRKDALLDQLKTVRTALDDLGSWEAAGRVLQGDFASRLHRWLELVALADMAARHKELASALLQARDRGWRPDWADPVGLFQATLSEAELETLEKQAAAWEKERDDLLQEVMSGSNAPRVSTDAPARRPLRPSEILALNALGVGLTGEEAARNLGEALYQALRDDRLVPAGPALTLGLPRWADSLKDSVTEALAAVEELAQIADRELSESVASRLQSVQDVLRKQGELDRQRQGIDQTFLRKIMAQEAGNRVGEPILDRALNELLWLFTPARWVYEALSISYRTGEKGEQNIELRTGGSEDAGEAQGSEAVLRFNTAELNVFTLALFLLCAIRIQNPYRLLVLDDPLQNMDELTVTTVARGLARLIRILPEGWEILALFHGEDDLERFRRELPALVYLLEWQSPNHEAGKPIRRDERRSWTSSALQDFSSEPLFEFREP